MAIRGGSSRSSLFIGKNQTSVEEFKNWMMRFDSDRDGRISRKELQQAIKSRGGWFNRHKTRKAMKDGDANEDGYVDENEIESLLDFAEKSMGFKFYFG